MEILLIILAVVFVAVAAALGSIAFGVWVLQRHNRVSPGSPTGAPLVWLCSPSRPARTHRRLRTAAATARTVPRQADAPTHSRSALSTDLERQAVALDEWVVWTARAPSRWRRDHYRAIQAQVRQLEALTMRLTSIDEVGPHHSVDASREALDDVAERLSQLELAQAEVEALEHLTLGTAPLPNAAPTNRPDAPHAALADARSSPERRSVSPVAPDAADLTAVLLRRLSATRRGPRAEGVRRVGR